MVDETPAKAGTAREGSGARSDRRPGTAREGSGGRAGGKSGTVREGGSGQVGGKPGTAREHGEGTGLGGAGFPAELAERFRVVRRLAAVGGEADVFEAEQASDGARRLVKVYRRGHGVKADALAKVQAIDNARVAGLFEFGQLSDGRWFEVQEFIDADDLGAFRRSYGDKLPARVLLEIVRELDAAVAAFHGAGLAHHDVKPENVLVRSRRPVGLVLIDFGLAVSSWDDDAPLTNRHATVAYQAPEVMWLQGGFARDRWSMGMTIAMVATGHVPYHGIAEGDILRSQSRQEPPPLIAQVPDPRVRSLCSGLTRYDVNARWGADQVAAWLAGENPPVPDERPRSEATAPSVRFDGREYHSPAALAVALLEHPAAAENQLKSAARRHTMIDQLLSVFGGPTLNELDQRWSAESEAPTTQQAIAELAIALDPDAVPTLRGRPITPAELALIGHDAARGDTESGRIVAILAAAPVLAAWGRGTAHPEFAEIERRWRQALKTYEAADQNATEAGAEHADDTRARAMILTAILDPDYAQTLIKQRARSVPNNLSGQDWYRSLAKSTQPGTTVAAIVYAPEAKRLATEDRAVTAEQTRRQRRERWANRRRRWSRSRVTRLRRIQTAALLALIGAVYIEYDSTSAIGWFAGGVFDAVGPVVADLLVLRPDLLALVIGTVATLMLRTEASGWRMRYQLAATLAAVGGILYTLGAIGPATAMARQDLATLMVILYATATAACGWSAVDSWIGRLTSRPAATDDRRVLRNADRIILTRTLTATLTLVVPVLIGLAWIWHSLDGVPPEGSLKHLLLVSPPDFALAAVTKGFWLPLAVGTILLILRGNWNRRPYGMKAAAALATATVVAYLVGGAQSDDALLRTRDAFITTPISEEVVEGGFCGRVWTGTSDPNRTAISGPGCRVIHHYDGWRLSWTYWPPSSPDELLSIDGMYLVLSDNVRELTALDGRTGDVAWERSCPDDTLSIDESQLDQGDETPSDQRVIGTCGDGEFNLDPRTGE